MVEDNKKINNPTQRQTGKEDPYAYTITDKIFGEFKVLNSANAWWIDRVKVGELIKAYKIDCPDEEACVFAGITLDQYKYFKELHPEFSAIKAACKELPNLSARNTVVAKIPENYSNAMDYLSRKKKSEFSQKSEIEQQTTVTLNYSNPEVAKAMNDAGEKLKEIYSKKDGT